MAQTLGSVGRGVRVGVIRRQRTKGDILIKKANANGAAAAADDLRRPTVLQVIDIRSCGSLAAGEASAFALDPPSAVVLQLRISEAGCEAPLHTIAGFCLRLFRRCRAAPT